MQYQSLTTDQIYAAIKAEYPECNPVWLKKQICTARYLARKKTSKNPDALAGMNPEP